MLVALPPLRQYSLVEEGVEREENLPSYFFFFQAEDGIRADLVTGVQTCALPIYELSGRKRKFCDAGLPAKLTQVLEAAAPVYRAHHWPDHDRANRRWIMRVAPLVREQGVGLSKRLADIYQTRWPREKIRVDVTGYANWTGAYTTADPLRVTISGLDARNQGT